MCIVGGGRGRGELEQGQEGEEGGSSGHKLINRVSLLFESGALHKADRRSRSEREMGLLRSVTHLFILMASESPPPACRLVFSRSIENNFFLLIGKSVLVSSQAQPFLLPPPPLTSRSWSWASAEVREPGRHENHKEVKLNVKGETSEGGLREWLRGGEVEIFPR